MQFRFAALLYCAAALSPVTTGAQQHVNTTAPTDAAAVVPQPKYESVFTGYLPFREERVAPWREVNDEAARVGGHLGIFGGAVGHAGHGASTPGQQPAVPGAKPPAPASPHMMDHGDKGGMRK